MRLTHISIGIVLLVVAGVLLVFFRDDEFFWFRGQPLGIVLAVLGLLDLVEGVRRKR